MSSDWLTDILKDLGHWHRTGYLAEMESQHPWGDSDTIWRACMQPIRMPPGSRPPRGAEPPTRSLDAVIGAINALMEVPDVAYSIAIMRAFYLVGADECREQLRQANGTKMHTATLYACKKQGEYAIRGYLSR